MRQLCPSHFVTTNNVPLVDTINMRDLYAKLDFVASDSYPGFSAIYSGQPGTSTPLEQVRHAIAFSHDFSRSIKNGKPFMIMEEQTGKAGQPFFSPQPEPGQLRLWAFQAIAHGASGVNFFRWDTAAFGAEEYWHGMLNHDRSKSPGFAEIERTMHEAKQLGAEVLGAPYEAALALCVDLNSGWALKIQPGQPKLSYLADAIAWYTCASASHAGIDVVDATGDLSRYKAVLAPLMYVVSREQAGQIRSYVQNGGTFISGVRLGVKDEHSQIVRMPLPGILRDVMGVTLLDYEPIYSEKQAVRFSSSLGSAEAECSLWADILDPHDAEVLATYTIGQYAGKAAVTSHRYGKGRALYVGAHLEGADLARVLLALLGQSGVQSRLRASPSIEITTRRVGGQVITYLLNHAPNPETVSASGKDLLSGESFSGSVPVEPYGVRVLRQ